MSQNGSKTLYWFLNPALTVLAVAFCGVVLWNVALEAQFFPNGHLRYIIDSDVYRLGTAEFWRRGDVFGHPMPSRYVELPFIYPPFAPLIMGPVALLNDVGAGLAFNLMTLIYLLAISYAIYTAYRTAGHSGVDQDGNGDMADYQGRSTGYLVRLKRAGERARGAATDRFGYGLPMSGLGAVALFSLLILATEPLHSTLLFGQINLSLAGLVVLDVLWDERRRPRWLPAGLLTGLAVAIKLTPAIFIVFWFFFKGLKSCWALIGGFVGATLLAALWSPRLSIEFFTNAMWTIDEKVGVAFGRNVSINGVLLRLETPHWLTMVLSALTVIVAIIACRRLLREGRVGLAMSMIGLAGLMVSPISWTHHWVWLSLLPIFLWMEGRWWLGAIAFGLVSWMGSLNARPVMEELVTDSSWQLHLAAAGYPIFSAVVLVLFAVWPRLGLRRHVT